MSEVQPPPKLTINERLDSLAAERPDIVQMSPFFAYLILMAVAGALPPTWYWAGAVLRGVGGLAVVWVLRKHLPPWGKPHVGLAIVAGVVAAFGWYYGQVLFNAMGIPHRMPIGIFPGQPLDGIDEKLTVLHAGGLFWLNVTLKIAVAATTVAVVEEIFWRSCLLRAFIDWSRFEKLPLGTFGWRAFIGTALLSTIQHPDNWVVSIFCWLFFNALMYWKKSILFLVLVHGITNVVLYAWVLWRALAQGDRFAWTFW